MSSSAIVLECKIGEAGLKLGINAELFVRERTKNVRSITVNIGDLAHINVYLKVVRPEAIVEPIRYCIISINFNIGIIVDYANRKRCKSSRAGLIIVAGTYNYDSGSIVFFINVIGRGEALSQFHMIKFPMVAVVEVYYKLNCLNCFDVGSVYVHPVKRTAIETVKSRISRNYLNGRCIHAGLNLDKSDYHRLIAHIVSNFKLNAMNTVCNCNLRNGHSTIRICNRNLYTVNISLSTVEIKAGCIGLGGIFCNKRRNSEKIALSYGGLILLKHDRRIVTCKLYLAKDRSLSVINSIRVVYGDVVDIYSLKTVDSSVCLPKIIGVSVREHKLNESEVICIILRSVVCQYILAVNTGNKYLIVCTYINGEVSPSGFINSIVNFGLIDYTDSVFGFKFSVIISIDPIKNTNPAMLVFIGNICPETNRLSIFNNYTLIKEEVRLTVSTGRNTRSRYRIHLYSHRSGTVMNLSVNGGCIAEMLIETIIVAVYVSNVPTVNIRGLFKIKENLRTLTEIQLGSSNEFGIMYECSGEGTLKICGSIFFTYRSELQTVECTECRISSSKYNVCALQNNVVDTIVDSCSQTNSNFLTKRNSHYLLREGERGRNYDLNRSFTYNRTIPYHLNSNFAGLTVGGEYAVFDSTKAIVLKLPFNISGNFSLSTYKVGTENIELHGAAGSVILVLAGDICSCKLTGCGSGRNEENTGSCRTLCTVRGRVVYLKLFAGTLRKVGRGSTTVTVNCIRAAKIKHNLSKLVHRHTCGIGRLTTVVKHDNYCTVGFDTYHRTRCRISVVRR